MKKTVYAVTSGCYSDYNVHAIYESRADAEAVVERAKREYFARDLAGIPRIISAEQWWNDYGERVEEFDFHPADTPIRPVQPASDE